MDRRNAYVFIPGFLFVFFYSFLPHKELRFIFPALTLFNCIAASGMSKIMRDLSKSPCFNMLLKLGLIGGFGLSAVYICFMTYVSMNNYPGGDAMLNFNDKYFREQDLEERLPNPHIHIDIYPAMTGVTRFMYENEDFGWVYSRTENLTDQQKMIMFTHLMTDREYVPGFRLYEVTKCFERVDFRGRDVLFKDCVYTHEREGLRDFEPEEMTE